MIRPSVVTAILDRGTSASQFDVANAKERNFAAQFLRLLTRCSFNNDFAQRVIDLLTLVNDSDDFVFDEKFEVFDEMDEHESSENDKDYCKQLTKDTVEVLSQPWTFHGASFSLEQVEKALEEYRKPIVF